MIHQNFYLFSRVCFHLEIAKIFLYNNPFDDVLSLVAMIDKPTASHTLGLELSPTSMKGAQIVLRQGKPFLEQVFDMPVDVEHVETSEKASPLDLSDEGHQLYELADNNLVVTSLPTSDILIRPLEVKLAKMRDVDAVLSFQAEPLLPYPAEDALIDRIFLSKDQEGTHLTLCATKKSYLEHHLGVWESLHIEPEMIACTPVALASFAQHLHQSESPFIVLYLGLNETSAILLKENKLIAAYSCSTDLSGLVDVYMTETNKDSQEEALKELRGFKLEKKLPQKTNAYLQEWALDVTKILFSLDKQSQTDDAQTILLTGAGGSHLELAEKLCEKLKATLVTPKSDAQFPITEAQLQKYAVPIGLALSALPKAKDQVNFRQEEFLFPNPWKRLKRPLITYLGCALLVAFAFNFYGNASLKKQEDTLKQEYVDLVSFMHKPYGEFEEEYAKKNPSETENPKELAQDVKKLTLDGLIGRINQLSQTAQSLPETFPLQPNMPKVSDLLAWLSTHPQVVLYDAESGERKPLIEIENLTYTVVKRPDKNRPQEKYQVKVDLEFSSSQPKFAREFHDALLESNAFVAPKSEVKWTFAQGKYRASFFLKDQTIYPPVKKG